MARAALAKVELNTRDSASFMVDKSVMRVGKCPDTPSGERLGEMLSELVGFSAGVRPYTLFGLPEGKILISCQGGMRWVFF